MKENATLQTFVLKIRKNTNLLTKGFVLYAENANFVFFHPYSTSNTFVRAIFYLQKCPGVNDILFYIIPFK